MFYRRLRDNLFTPSDLTNAFEGAPIFIIGGNPIINQMPMAALERSRLPTLALNNVPYVYPNPTMWLTADKPACFGGHFFARADIIKFAYMNYKDEIVAATGKRLCDHPMQFLYTATDATHPSDIFLDRPALTWWRSVFPLSLEVCWRLGCRRVYLVGCSFTSTNARPYAWNAQLSDFESKWSRATYNSDVLRLGKLLPYFKENGIKIFSCTENSQANALIPHIRLEDAINYELRLIPGPTSVADLKHSSEFRPKGS